MLLESTSSVCLKAIMGIDHWNLKRPVRERLLETLGQGSRVTNALASNMSLRHVVGCRLVDEFVELQRRKLDFCYYHATFIDDQLRTRDLETHMAFDRFVKKIRAVLTAAGIDDWLLVLELQPYVNWKKGKGRDIAPHAHVIFWCRGIDHRALEARLRRSKRFVSLTDAPTVTITRRRGEGNIAHMIAYPFKGPERGANLIEDWRYSGQAKQMDAAIRPDTAVRLMEILSQFKLTELIRSSGEGKHLFDRLRETINQRVATKRSKPSMTRAEAASAWRVARLHAGTDQYSPVGIER